MGALAVAILGTAFLARDTGHAQTDGVQLQSGFTNVAYLGPTLPLLEALTNAEEEVSAIWSFRADASEAPWRLWNRELPPSVQGFDTLEFGRAYFFVSDAPVLWEYAAGDRPEPPAVVDLQPGLNHVVYFGATLPVETALADPGEPALRSQQTGAGACVTLIWAFSGTWTVWQPTLPQAVQGFTELRERTSYFVAADEACTWTFPPASTSLEPPEPPAYDFGDAPDSYGTTAVADGARHVAVDGVFLGETIDTEDDGQPGADAVADDDTGEPDDEDGVLLPQLTPGGTISIDVIASTEGFLDAWIDFNGDGRFDEPGDRIFTVEPLTTGVNRLTITIPADLDVIGVIFARFRFSLSGGLGPTGAAQNGEVEDYGTTLFDEGDPPPPPPPGCPLVVC